MNNDLKLLCRPIKYRDDLIAYTSAKIAHFVLFSFQSKSNKASHSSTCARSNSNLILSYLYYLAASVITSSGQLSGSIIELGSLWSCPSASPRMRFPVTLDLQLFLITSQHSTRPPCLCYLCITRAKAREKT